MRISPSVSDRRTSTVSGTIVDAAANAGFAPERRKPRTYGSRRGERPLRARTPQAAHLRVPARLRESTHDSLAAPPVTVRAAHGRFAGHSPLLSRMRRAEPR